MNIYQHRGESFSFNDTVEGFCTGVIGSLVQVRLKCGQFGSDVYFIRKFDGSLTSLENEWIEKLDIDNPEELDEPDQEYTLKGEYPEKGFIIQEPKGWNRVDTSFSITISKKDTE